MKKEEIYERLEAMRAQMKKAGVDATIIPQVDPHHSEYIASHWQVRRFLSGFTGSAGDLVITPDNALLWTDSRYFIQAAQQLEGTPYILMKDGLAATPSIIDWICTNVTVGSTVGVNGLLFSHAAVRDLASRLEAAGIKLVTDFDPVDALWSDRPTLPNDKVFIHDEAYAGESAASKIKSIIADAQAQHADAALLTSLDDIAWTLNIRSNDVRYNPVAISYLYLAPKGSTLFIKEEKIDDEVRRYLAAAGVAVAPYDTIICFLEKNADKNVLVEEQIVSERLWSALGSHAHAGKSPVPMLKGVKNGTQVAGVRAAMERDGAALVKSFMEIEKMLAEGKTITEMTVADILEKHRSAMPGYFELSFGTIAGYGPHGAIVHYEADEESNATLRPEGLLLVDSGAQYLDGTTDITRTVALGTPTAQEKSDFTAVMKGHIALATAVFPEGTRGASLNVLAHQYLWKQGLNYLHGTGHGVGHFLNVHEGPQNIRFNDNPTPMTPGMITSDEPGVYREGIHGIRCENLVLTVPAYSTEFGNFLKFEVLTLFPFDRSLFDMAMMTPEEIAWVDNYHKMVYDRISPLLDETEKAWLAAKTMPLAID